MAYACGLHIFLLHTACKCIVEDKERIMLVFYVASQSVNQFNQSVNQNISTLGSSPPAAAAEFNLPTNALLNPNPNPPDEGCGWI